jgi:serine/threonine-protein kinase
VSQKPEPSQPETIIDARYRVVRLLGEGGFGQVFECRHVGTRRAFAVKLLLPEIARRPGVLTRFLREAQTAGSIKSPNVVDVIDVGQCRSTNAAFMAMEMLAGEDLAKHLEERGPLAPDQVLRIAAQALVGLCAAHAEGVVHRDIKPPNLFLARTGEGQRTVKVLDFGIAKVLGEDNLERAKLTVTGSILGSPWYMSPEQAAGLAEIDHRTDIWSLGAVLYEALSGVTPYHGVTTLQQLLRQICEAAPKQLLERVPGAPPALAAIVTKAMAHDPTHRYQSAAEMLDAVTKLLGGAPVITDAMLGDGAARAVAGDGRDRGGASEGTGHAGPTEPMPAGLRGGTQGGLARTANEAPRRRAYVLGGAVAAVSVTLAVLALVFLPKPGGAINGAADAGTTGMGAAGTSTGATATATTLAPAPGDVAAPDGGVDAERDAGASEDASGGRDAGKQAPSKAEPKQPKAGSGSKPDGKFTAGRRGI